MIRHRFQYHTPHSLAEAVDLLAEGGNCAAVIGGGTWLVPHMSSGVRRPGILIDLRHLNLKTIAETGGGLLLGARTTYSDVLRSSQIGTRAPLLAAMANQVTGGAQIRNQGTLCGSACYASPSADVPGCLVALDAQMHLLSRSGTRVVPAGEFFQSSFEADLRSDEMVSRMFIPDARPGECIAYTKLKISAGSWPIVTTSCIGRASSSEALRFRTVIGGAGQVPALLETELPRSANTREIRAYAEEAAARVLSPISDELAEAEYRRVATAAVVARTIMRVQQALSRG